MNLDKIEQKFGNKYSDDKDSLRAVNGVLWIAIIALLVIIFLLFVGYIVLSNNVSISTKLPPQNYIANDDIKVSSSDANQNYFKAWGLYFVNESANFGIDKKDNIQTKIDIIKSYMSYKDYAKNQKGLDDILTGVLQNNIKQKFNIDKVDIEQTNNVCKITTTGTAIQNISYKAINKECKYDITIKYTNGDVYVQDYYTNCFDSF